MKRARRLRSNATEPKVGRQGGLEVQRLTIGRTRYVQTYIRCGPRCTRCTPGDLNYDPDRPGHGPYWYAVVEREGKTPIRRYCGRDLEAHLSGERARARAARSAANDEALPSPPQPGGETGGERSEASVSPPAEHQPDGEGAPMHAGDTTEHGTRELWAGGVS